MIWLNDIIGAAKAEVEINGARFRFHGVMPSVLVDPETARLTPTQERILQHLRDNADRCVSGFELRDAALPDRDESGVRVQVHRMRRKGVAIDSRPGPHGGYQLSTISGSAQG